MKMQFVNRLFKLTFLVLLASMVMISCKKDDDEDDDTPPVIILDGAYIMGDAFAFNAIDGDGAMDAGINENGGEARLVMYEMYVALSATGGFNIVMVNGDSQTTYGPDAMNDVDLTGVSEAPQVTIQKGTYKETTDQFTVPNDGMYKVVIDTELGVVVIIPVIQWGVLGGSTVGGWGSDQPIPLTSGFDKNAMTFSATEVTLLEGTLKFRQDGGWKVDVSEDGSIMINTNFGNTVDELIRGGADIVWTAEQNGVYTISLNWTIAGGYTADLEKTGDAQPVEYPEAMYVVGNATAYGWATPGDDAQAIMHKCAGGVPTEGVYWKVCHMYADSGFKVSDAGWGSFNYGFSDIQEFDADGVTVSDLDGNMSVATSGMYMIVLDLRDDMVKLSVKAPEVYGMGGAFGGWDIEDNPDFLFTVDNVAKSLTSPAVTADDNIRMYAQHPWIQDWWNAEFNVFNGVIEYRNDGGDQDAVAGTTGQVVTLMFDDNTGSIN